MYRCGITGKLSRPGEKVNKIVLERREKVYYGEVYDEDTDTYTTQPVAKGWEIVKEINATDEGLALWKKTQAALLPDEK